jgi:ABC-type branched-subunit amino acid transport system ATPase component
VPATLAFRRSQPRRARRSRPFILRIKHDLELPIVWIEHDMQMVADVADRVHMLNYSRTLASVRK